MISGPLDSPRPKTVDEALGLLAKPGDRAKIDVTHIEGMAYVEERGDHLAIGAQTKEVLLVESALVAKSYPLLLDTVKVIADPSRGQSTVGGILANADPADDHPATMLAYGATIVAIGPKGERTIAIDDFFVGPLACSLATNELLTEIRIPKPRPGSGGAYLKIERKLGDHAFAAIAVQLTFAGGKITAVRIGLTNVAPVPARAQAAEAALIGTTGDETALEAAGMAAARECESTTHLPGQVDHKRDLIRVITKRVVRRAIERAKGG